MNTPSYKVGPFKDGATTLTHNEHPIAVIEQYHHHPEKVRNIFGKVVNNDGKFLTRYRVTQMGGFPEEDFRTVKGAVKAAASFHRNNSRLTEVHPTVAIATHVNAATAAIHAAASDHRITDDEQEKLLELSKAQANVRNLLSSHFGHHVNR